MSIINATSNGYVTIAPAMSGLSAYVYRIMFQCAAATTTVQFYSYNGTTYTALSGPLTYVVGTGMQILLQPGDYIFSTDNTGESIVMHVDMGLLTGTVGGLVDYYYA